MFDHHAFLVESSLNIVESKSAQIYDEWIFSIIQSKVIQVM